MAGIEDGGYIIGVVRALGREHQPEEFHLMTLGHLLDVNKLTTSGLLSIPTQPGKALGAMSWTETEQTLGLDRA